MRLRSVAQFFNNLPCLDAYTGDLAFYGQLGLFDDNKRDSETAERRLISVDVDVTIPPRRVVSAAGTHFIIGHANPDSFQGSTLRLGLVAHEATELSQIRTFAQVCLNQPGTTAYAGRSWVKNQAFTEQSSHLASQAHIHFAVGEPVDVQSIITFGGNLHVVRQVTELGPAGTRIALADELPAPTVEDVVVSSGAYDPITDTLVAGTTSVRVLRVRWQSLFVYRNGDGPTFGPADIQVVIAKAALTATPGMRLALSDGTWQLASCLDDGDVWLCRATRHG